MAKKHTSLIAGALVAAGAVVGAVVASKWYERRLVDGDVIISNVRRLFTVVGTIEGSWIEMEPVFVENETFTGYAYFGGVTRQEGSELVQYEFYADAKTGAVMDLYKIA